MACCPDENRPIVSECTSLPSKYLTCGQDISQCAPLYLGPRAALAGGWPRNAPADAVLSSPGESCFAIFPGGPLKSAGKQQSSGLPARPRVPGLGACYRGPSICVATFHGAPEYGVSRLAGVSFWLAFRTRTGRRCRKIRITQTSGNYMKPVDSFCLFLQWSWRFVTISIYSFILQPTCRKRYFQPISAKMFS